MGNSPDDNANEVAPVESFPTGRLWERVHVTARRAQAGGRLQPITTEARFVDDHGIRFAIRLVTQPMPKPPAHEKARTQPNPFLPYDRALWVADVSATHVALLNKYQVVSNHLLIVTRQFEPQTDQLTRHDFEALATCMREAGSIGFYNAGPDAGASQSHRHLQLLPLGGESPAEMDPLTPPASPPLPIESVFSWTTAPILQARVCPRLPFAHHYVVLDRSGWPYPDKMAEQLESVYKRLLAATGWTTASDSTPYNLLITHNWMLFVPRREECFAGISLNAMAYVGGLLVHNDEQLQQLSERGPSTALQATAGAKTHK